VASNRNDTLLNGVFQRVDLITSEIQEGMMKTRMQAVGSVWSKLPRLVRDVSARCNKQVRLEMEGQDTEVDRTLLDAIRDPLTHIVRNSIDHGIESPEAREAAGKPREGVIRLRAWHEGGQVNIEIADDGAGLNLERVRQKAVEKGLISPEQAGRMTPRELQDLIFMPGFSTAEKVTSVSGRGVGMDVVRTDIAAVNGTVDITSESGRGTTLKLGIPLTLAIIPALLVWSHEQRFAIPQVSIVQLMRLDGKLREQGIAKVHDTRVFRHRDELLPLLSLEEELQIGDPGEAENDDRQVVVLQSSERRFGLVVDRVGDCGEIVVKPLSRVIKPIGAYVGGTITGDGAVALILDVAGLARRARLVADTHTATARTVTAVKDSDQRRLLILQTPDDGRAAIELDGVNRLEEFNRRFVEKLGGQEVVRYRGQILPLVRVSRVLLERRIKPRRAQTLTPDEPDMIQVIVHAGPEGPVGIVVDQTHDILDVEIGEQRPPVRAGVHFSTLIGDRVVELLDSRWLVAQAANGDDHA
jgi:two-component system chemotaxis sensor kinase CheA